jgi:hypothetical protein
VEQQQPRGVGEVLGGGEDVGRWLTYIAKSLGFVLGFGLSPQTNRLVGDKEPEKERKMGCSKETDRAKARD